MTRKKGPTAGSGGQGRRKLEGRGPTPPAERRPGHPAQRRAAAAARSAERRPPRPADDVVTGRNAVVEALQAAVPATTLHVATGLEPDRRVRDAVRLAGSAGVPVREAGRAELDRLSGGAVHQGLVLATTPYAYVDPADLLDRARDNGATPLLVALDGVTDPRNLGAVVRSAAAFGAHGVVIPARRSAAMTAGAWKASAGAAARIAVARATNLPRALRAYADGGLTVVGLAADGDTDLADLDGADPLVLVVGAEDRGLSRLVGEQCDVHARIPLAAGAESLNAGVAAGIALYSIAAQRSHRGRL